MVQSDSLNLKDSCAVADSLLANGNQILQPSINDWFSTFIAENGLYIIIGTLFVIIILSIMLYRAYSRIGKLKTFNAHTVFEKEWLEKRIYQLERHNQELQSSPTIIKPQVERATSPSTPPIQSQPSQPQLEPQYTYFTEASNGRFSKGLETRTNKCFFRAWREQGEILYEFCGNETVAIANMNATFDGVCQLRGKSSNAKHIVNVQPGLLDGQYRVIKQAVIQLIP